jgi:uncharacterized protein (TIGR04222 family)
MPEAVEHPPELSLCDIARLAGQHTRAAETALVRLTLAGALTLHPTEHTFSARRPAAPGEGPLDVALLGLGKPFTVAEAHLAAEDLEPEADRRLVGLGLYRNEWERVAVAKWSSRLIFGVASVVAAVSVCGGGLWWVLALPALILFGLAVAARLDPFALSSRGYRLLTELRTRHASLLDETGESGEQGPQDLPLALALSRANPPERHWGKRDDLRKLFRQPGPD